MSMVYTFVFTLAVIFHSVESSLQGDNSPGFPRRQKLPVRRANQPSSNQPVLELGSQADENLDTRRNPGSPSSSRQQSPDRTSPERPPLHGRSRSPRGRPPSSEVLGYTLRELGYIRLSPRTNPSLQFEFRRYIIRAGKPIRVREGHTGYVPVPTREHIVLSASNGDIFAILEYSGVLRGLYSTSKNHPRAKINMMSGAVNHMTSDEVRDCPVGGVHPIFPHNFIKVVTECDSLRSESNPNSERNPVSSSSAIQHSPDLTSSMERPLRARSTSPPGKPPSDEVLGYALGQLGYIRIIPRTNHNRRFEFRRYIFPADKRINLHAGKGRYVPVSNREYIVLSTANGDVFAILEYTGILRGIYKTHQNHHRIKINMIYGAVDHMTADEIKECKVGNPISPNLFTVVVANDDSMETVYH